MGQNSIEFHYPFTNSVIGSNNIQFEWEGCETCDFQLDTTSVFSTPLINLMDLDTQSQFVGGIDFDKKYYWRIRNSGQIWNQVDSFYLFNPSALDGLQLWLNADSLSPGLIDSPINTWQDLTGSGIQFEQPDNDSQPILKETIYNQKLGVEFDGSDDIMFAGDVLDIFDEDKTVIILYQPVNETYGVISKGIFGSDIGTYSFFPANGSYRFIIRESALKNLTATIPHEQDKLTIMRGEYDREAANMRIFIDGNSGGQLGNTDQFTSYDNDVDLVIGGVKLGISSFRFNGLICQVMIFNSIPNEDDFQLIENYFRYEYSPPVDLGFNFTLNNFCDTVLRVKGFKNVIWNNGSTEDSLVVSSSGKYWVTVEDIFGHISSDTIEIEYPGNFISDFSLCFGEDSIWNTGLSLSDYSFNWNDNSTDSILTISNSGAYFVEITDGEGCVFETDTVDVSIDNFPLIASLGADVDLCSGNSISLVAGNEEAQTYLWIDDSEEESIEVSISGNYWVEVVNDNQCIAYDTIFVNIIGQAPTANFSFDNLCLGEIVEFTDLSTPPSGESIGLWGWDFGDNSTSVDQNPDHSYDTLGTYSVFLYIETEAGCSDSISAILNINPVPEAGFSIENLCANQLTFFSDNSSIDTGTLIGWSWTFGDNESGFGSIVNHEYEQSGLYNVQYIVTSDAGCMDTVDQMININGSPITDFTTNSNCLGQFTIFNAQVDDSESGPITSYSWDFDGGFPQQSIFPNTTSTYFIPGQYLVTLTATSQFGCSHDTIKTITINDLPNAGFTHIPACINEPTLFTDTTEIFMGDSISNWSWNFSNLGVSNEQDPIYSFVNLGSYIVSLTVTSQAGCESQAESVVNVFEDPNPNFSFDPVIGLPPLNVTFENLTQDAESYLWNFGDGGSSTDISPEYVFNDTGIFSTTMIAFNEQGCQEALSQEVLVIEPLFDLALLDLNCNLTDGKINAVATIFNFGNHDLLNFDLKLDIGNGAKISEKFSGTIQPGASEVYSFSASPDFNSEINQPYLCVSLSNPNGNNQEISNLNNSMCKAISDDAFIVFPPFPNPAFGTISFNFILPGNGLVLAEIFDIEGRKVKERQLEGVIGVNLGSLTIPELRNGNYVLKISFNNAEQTHWFNVK